MEYQIYESYDTFLLYQEFMEIPGNTFKFRLPEGMILTTENFKTSYVEVYPTFSRYFYLLLSIFPFIFPDFYHFYQASAHILFPIQYLTNSPTLQYFLNIFLFSPGKYFYNSQSGMGCSSDVFTTENAWP